MRGAITVVAALLLNWSCAAAAEEKPICADRPSKSTGACTVPAGHWQIETGLIDWTHDRSNGDTTDFTVVGSSLVKLGVSGDADVEVGFSPLEILRLHGASGRAHETGFGDMVLRIKYHLTRDGAPIDVALDPFMKLPTASHDFGNGKVEGGLVVPADMQLGKSGLTLSMDPEVDLLADSGGHGHHLAMTQVLNVGMALNDRLGVSAEVWGQWDWDPAGTGKQVSVDGSATYLLNKDVQLDAGANFGLNSQTPDVELYAGISARF